MWCFDQTYEKKIQTISILIALTAITLFLNGCSNVSMSQLDSDVQKELRMIDIEEISSREGQLYNRELRKLLHVGGKANVKYTLKSTISYGSSGTLSSELNKMTMEAFFTLYDQEEGKILISDSVFGDATLGTVSSLFGQSKAETHAKERLAMTLAQRVTHRLQLYFLNPTLYFQELETKPKVE